MGGSGGTRTETGTLPASIPPQLQPLVDRAVAGSTDAMDTINLDQFTGPNVQEIPGLTGGETNWINAIQQWASSPNLTAPADQGLAYTGQGAGSSPYEDWGAGLTGSASNYDPFEVSATQYDPFEQIGGLRMQSGGDVSSGETQAMGMLGRGPYGGPTGVSSRDVAANTDTENMRRAQALFGQLTTGDIGSSPATLQAMKAWEDLTKPQILAGQAISGNLGGGSTEEALAHGSTEALTPLLAQEIQNRKDIASTLGGFGLQESGLKLQADTGSAERAQSAQESTVRAGLEAAGLDQNAAAQLASIAAGAKGRELQAGGALAALGGAKKGREAAVGGAKKGRELAAGGQLAAIGAGQQNRKLAAGAQSAAIGTEKANLQISAMTTALEKAGMPREIATQQAQAAYQDFLRRQGMAESLYEGPTGNFLAGALTPGSLVQSRQTGGGMFGS